MWFHDRSLYQPRTALLAVGGPSSRCFDRSRAHDTTTHTIIIIIIIIILITTTIVILIIMMIVIMVTS